MARARSGRECAVPPQERLEIRAVDIPHRDEEAAVGLAGLVDRDDVRVVEARREPRLAQQSLAEALVVGERFREELERDRPLEPNVARAVDVAHATAPDEGLDLVAGDDVAWRDSPSYRHVPSARREPAPFEGRSATSVAEAIEPRPRVGTLTS